MKVRALGRCRLQSAVAACVLLAAFLTLLSYPPAEANTPTPVYFFSNNAEAIGPHNPLVARPSGFVLFLDGQWVLQDLRWHGWGTQVARATGISNSSNDIPDAASGKRIKTWADMTLSDPVRWRGREVYSCYQILVPPPASDSGGCVLPDPPAGNGWLSAGAGNASFLTPSQNVSCYVNDVNAVCNGGPGLRTKDGAGPRRTRSWVPPPLGASLFARGNVVVCSVPSAKGGCAINWSANSPVLEFGREIRVGDLLCKSQRSGIVCTIASGGHKGRGFLINSTSVRQL